MKTNLHAFLLLLSSFAPPLLAQDPAPHARDMTMVLTGDSIINRRLSTFDALHVDEMFTLIRKADVAFTNFETLIHDFRLPPAAQSGGTYMGSPAFVTDELEWAGFDMVAAANNHTGDYGLEGLRSTQAALAKSKLVYAGIGDNLARARSPAYFDALPGRVALISVSSTFSPGSLAGPQRKDIIGRPGLNPLRFTVTYTVDPKTIEAFKQLAGPTAEKKNESGEPVVEFLNTNFKSGDTLGMTTKPDKSDLKEIVASVQDARQQADWVIVSIHCHENPGHDKIELPAEFLVTFSRAMIDAGADVLVGHGPHFLKGIEIYKGKPIFYSLGNFIFENDLVDFQPAENYLKNDLPPDALPSDFYTKRAKTAKIDMLGNRIYWQSVIVKMVFAADHTLQAVNLHPVALGFGKSRSQRGRPYPAAPAEAKTIIDDLTRLSKPMGTAIRFENGIGVIMLK